MISSTRPLYADDLARVGELFDLYRQFYGQAPDPVLACTTHRGRTSEIKRAPVAQCRPPALRATPPKARFVIAPIDMP
jgi:hypothetical protein